MKKAIMAWLLVSILLISTGCGLFGNKYEKDSVKAAESYVTSAFRKEVGFAADSLDSEVLYSGTGQNESEVYLIGVTCYLDDTATANYCVYCINGVKCGATQMLAPGYDFDDNMNDLKALFGIVD